MQVFVVKFNAYMLNSKDVKFKIVSYKYHNKVGFVKYNSLHVITLRLLRISLMET